jgi:cardiolipin synthase
MNIPNVLSVFRLALVPVFCIIFFSRIAHAYPLAALVYLVASVTDMLDGYIARRYHMVTKLGRILDPLADKLMAATALFCIVYASILPMWAFIIFALKECLMGLGAILLYKKVSDVLSANRIGKAATALFFTVCAVLLIFPGISHTAASIMIAAALGLSIAAMIIYLSQYIKVSRTCEKKL